MATYLELLFILCSGWDTRRVHSPLFMLEVTPELQQRLNHASLIKNTWHQLSKKEQDRLEAITQGRAFDKLDKKIKKT